MGVSSFPPASALSTLAETSQPVQQNNKCLNSQRVKTLFFCMTGMLYICGESPHGA